MKKIGLILALAACLLLGACSAARSGGEAMMTAAAMSSAGSAPQNSQWKPEAEMHYEMATDNMGGAGAAPSAAPPVSGGQTPPGGVSMSGEVVIDGGQKLIRTGYYSLETMDYPKTIQEIEALVNRMGGYIQASSASGEGAVSQGYTMARSARYTLRVPVAHFFETGKALGEIAAVVHSEQSAQEVTEYYYDTEARLKTLRVQEERLLALMSQATELEAIIALEQSMGQVRYEIESLEGTLRRLDSQISMSTLEISVQEVFEPTRFEPTPVTLGQRIAARFRATLSDLRRGLENLVVSVLGDGLRWIIGLAVVGAVALAARRIFRWAKGRRPAKKPPEDTTDRPDDRPE